MFDPFQNTRINELTPAALATLAQLQEGWFIEYKQEPCKPKDYAKAIAAFANGRGGWLFIGLAQDSTGRPAGGPGVPTTEVPTLLASVRDAVSHNLSPMPDFEMGGVAGPIPELGIGANSSVIVIHVPESQNTPHVHCSGRIYSRQGDKAAPLEITRRSELDHLYARGDRLRERIDQVLNRGFDMAWVKAIAAPWIYCAMIPSVTNTSRPTIPSFDSFRDIMSDAREGLKLSDVYMASMGYLARNHSDQVDPMGAALTLEYGFNGSIYLSFPLSMGDADSRERPDFLRSTNGTAFTLLLRNSRFCGVSVVDGTYLISALMGAHSRVAKLLRIAQIEGGISDSLQGLEFFSSDPLLQLHHIFEVVRGQHYPIDPSQRLLHSLAVPQLGAHRRHSQAICAGRFRLADTGGARSPQQHPWQGGRGDGESVYVHPSRLKGASRAWTEDLISWWP